MEIYISSPTLCAPFALLLPLNNWIRIKMAKSGTIKQFFELMMERKAWWLFPIVVVFLALGGLMVLTSGSALSPFIYALF